MTFRSRIYTTAALGAVARGVAAVVRAPVLLTAVFVATVLVTVPFAFVLGSELQTALASRQLTYGVTTDIDAEWWFQFERHAQGLAATFSPAVIGSAAPVSNISAVLDGTRPVQILLLPIVASTVMWAFLWGGILERWQHERRIGFRAFAAAGAKRFLPFLAVSAAAAIIYLLLYTTVHPLLFGPFAAALQAGAPGEREALFSRVILYLVFATCLMVVSVCADYARVFMVAHGTSLLAAMRKTRQFLAAHARTVALAHAVTAGLFLMLIVGYVVVDVFGGVRVGGWRAVVLGQMYVAGRLTLRLLSAATALALVRAETGKGDQSA
jgi:hypothetical protein